VQALAWAAVAWVSVLIVASRKHYSVDVVIAWCASAACAGNNHKDSGDSDAIRGIMHEKSVHYLQT
jgi:PAP2 superfamily C-terminal